MQDRLALNPLTQAPAARPATAASRPLPWLLAVAVAFTAAQLALVVPGSGLSWDETVYVSQVGGHAPAAFFSAPRARGISYLVAPVAELTTSTTALRVYLALLSGSGLFAALWIWRKLLPAPVPACAGALFAGLWITLYYGPAAMPNLWCALGALTATGCVLRAVRRDRGPGRDGGAGRDGATMLAGAGTAVAAVTLLRPSDGMWLALPLAAAVLAVPGRRRPAVLYVLVAGLVLGAAPWVAEAYAHYGGLSARLHRAGEIQGGLGWHLAVDDQVRALAGRTLCRPCHVPWKHPVTAVWWFALPVLVGGGIAAAHRARRGFVCVLATVTAVSLAAQYLFLIDYAAPRFLLPAYALLAVPAAECVTGLCTGVFTGGRPALRPVTATAVVLALVGHLAVQYRVLSRVVTANHSMSENYAAIAAGLHRLGVRPPCTVSGYQAPPIGYYAGCASRQTAGHDAATTPEGVTAAARRMPVAVIVGGRAGPPHYARTWRPVTLPHLPGFDDYRAYLPPTAAVPAKKEARP